MAVTSIWAVTHRVDSVLKYIKNPDKTIERPELAPEAIAARKAVGDVVNYVENSEKTEQMMFVSGINCDPKTAADDFLQTKLQWNKTDGRLAYHGYQAFREGDGEITAEKAHEIGVQLARELWGDRFEVVVATHLNTGHYHNHFLINSVSFADGKKYIRSNSDYRRMRSISDRLCREAKLHVVESPSITKKKSYDEWMAERQGKTTVRGLIREDIDYAIKLSRTEKQFAQTLKEMGYEFKFFKKDGTQYEHPGLKPPGAKGFFRFRGLGPNYDYDSIRRRIIQNTLVPGVPLLVEGNSIRKWNKDPPTDIKGLPLTYRRYCIRLYTYICRPTKKEYIPMALREDIAKLDSYIEQMDYLYQNRIESSLSLEARKKELKHELYSLITNRRKLYVAKKKAEKNHDAQQIESVKTDISDISRKIRELKKQVSICDSIRKTTDRVESGLDEPTKKPSIEPPITPPIKKQNRY